ncbi:hypothetical protein [Raoultella terrigena]|uniref:Uncharacterized protein n=1 Tax=Raoultella terrigena TaxID=577 RepID=A0A7Z8Z633_RAOTE|nr:Uncharacterised protein [Raoultella terrigena]
MKNETLNALVLRHGDRLLRQAGIAGAGVITDLLRVPGDPLRRWFDRHVLRDVVKEARAVNAGA